jgi:RND family efflux transporter MFP subunit
MITTRLLLPAVALLALACGDDPTPRAAVADAPVVVRTAPVATETVAATIRGTGILGAKDEIALSFKIGGIVADVRVDEGARVRRGDVLARLDAREIDALVAKAAAAVQKAERDSSRVARLYADSVASLSQYQDMTTALTAARADLATARVNHEFAVITAPTDGAVLTRNVNAGALAAPGQPVLTLASSARGSVLRVGLPDRDALRLRLGDSAVVEFAAVPGTRFRGVVSQRAAVTDARAGTIMVEVELRDVAQLPTGLVGAVTLYPAGRATGQVIPVAALLEGDGDAAVVFTVRDGTAQRVPVRVVRFVGTDRVAVTGLDGVDAVVVSGGAYLTAGAAAEVRS